MSMFYFTTLAMDLKQAQELQSTDISFATSGELFAQMFDPDISKIIFSFLEEKYLENASLPKNAPKATGGFGVLSDGQLVIGTHNNRIEIWSADQSQRIYAILLAHLQKEIDRDAPISALVVLPGNIIICGNSSSTDLMQIDCNNWQVQRIIPADRNRFEIGFRALALLSDNTIISIAHDELTDEYSGDDYNKSRHAISQWHLDLNGSTPTRITRFTGHKSKVLCLQPTQDRCFLSGDAQGTIKLWDSTTGTAKQTFEEFSSGINCIALLTHNRFVSGSKNREIKVWHINSNKSLKAYSAHIDEVTALASLPDGTFFSAGNLGDDIKQWDPNQDAPLRVFKNDREIHHLLVLPNKSLLAANRWGTLKVWRKERQQIEDETSAHANKRQKEISNEKTPRNLVVGTVMQVQKPQIRLKKDCCTIS